MLFGNHRANHREAKLDDWRDHLRSSAYPALVEVYDNLIDTYWYDDADEIGDLVAYILRGYDYTVPADVFAKFIAEYVFKHRDAVYGAFHFDPSPETRTKVTLAGMFIVANDKMLKPVISFSFAVDDDEDTII
jgi:hypothetical protein